MKPESTYHILNFYTNENQGAKLELERKCLLNVLGICDELRSTNKLLGDFTYLKIYDNDMYLNLFICKVFLFKRLNLGLSITGCCTNAKVDTYIFAMRSISLFLHASHWLYILLMFFFISTAQLFTNFCIAEECRSEFPIASSNSEYFNFPGS